MSLHNLEAEQALLGAVLDRPALWERISLRPEHFAEGPHQAIWAEICERKRSDRLCDAVAMKDWAGRQKALSPLGGPVYLLTLIGAAATFERDALGYAETIRDLARRRAVVEAARAAINLAEHGEQDALTDLERRLQEIASSDHDADAWTPLGELSVESVARAERGEARGISTGIAKLDELTGGMQPGTLWVIGAATSMGKSILGPAISRAVAGQGYGVGEIHLEMDALQIGLRTASALAFDPSHRVDSPYYLSAQRGALRPAQWDAMRGGARAAAGLPIHIDARPGRNVSQIEAGARRLFRKMAREGVKPGMLLIDHEGLIAAEPGAKFPSQLERTNARSEALLAMAKRLNVAVVALSQITKEGARADGDDTRMPNATDLAYGGAISQAATVVIMIHRRAYYAERKHPDKRTPEDWEAIKDRQATLIVDKVRGGMRGHVTVLLDAPTAAVWEQAA